MQNLSAVCARAAAGLFASERRNKARASKKKLDRIRKKQLHTWANTHTHTHFKPAETENARSAPKLLSKWASIASRIDSEIAPTEDLEVIEGWGLMLLMIVAVMVARDDTAHTSYNPDRSRPEAVPEKMRTKALKNQIQRSRRTDAPMPDEPQQTKIKSSES